MSISELKLFTFCTTDLGDEYGALIVSIISTDEETAWKILQDIHTKRKYIDFDEYTYPGKQWFNTAVKHIYSLRDVIRVENNVFSTITMFE